MKRWSVIIIIFLLICSTAIAIAFREGIFQGEANYLYCNAIDKPSVYVSSEENTCVNFSEGVYWVYVHSPKDNNLIYLNFNLYFDFGAPPNPIISPGSGVVLGDIDISSATSYQLEAAWTPRTLDHEPIIKLQYLTDPQLSCVPINVVFQNAQGISVPGYGFGSLSCCADKFECEIDFCIPDHVSVLIGETTIIPFKWSWDCWATGGGPLNASDSKEWLVTWEPTSAGGYPTFGLCIVPVFDGLVEVFVPEDVPVGTTSQLLISGIGSASVTLEAYDSTPIENKTWGEIKSLYR